MKSISLKGLNGLTGSSSNDIITFTMHVMSFVIEPRDAVGRQYKTTEPKRSQGHRVSSLNVDFIGLKISRDGDFIGSVPQGEKK